MRGMLIVFCLAGMFAACACGPSNMNTTYSTSEIGRTGSVDTGVIVAMYAVRTEQDQTPVGTLAGGALGAVAGSQFGGGTAANIAGGIVGGVVGGVAGHYTEKTIRSGDAVNFVIRRQNGQTVSVVQTNEYNFRVGDSVAIMGGSKTRLVPLR